jgi:hypothetical protein
MLRAHTRSDPERKIEKYSSRWVTGETVDRQKPGGNFARTYERRQALRKLRAPARVPLVRLPALQAGDARDDRQSQEDENKLASGQLFDENFCLRLVQLEMQLRIAFLEHRQTSRRGESHTCGREEVTGVSTVE